MDVFDDVVTEHGMLDPSGNTLTPMLLPILDSFKEASPCCFFHPKWLIRVVVHGDDLTELGTPNALDLYDQALPYANRN